MLKQMNLKKKITSISNLATTTVLNAKINEVRNEKVTSSKDELNEI